MYDFRALYSAHVLNLQHFLWRVFAIVVNVSQEEIVRRSKTLIHVGQTFVRVWRYKQATDSGLSLSIIPFCPSFSHFKSNTTYLVLFYGFLISPLCRISDPVQYEQFISQLCCWEENLSKLWHLLVSAEADYTWHWFGFGSMLGKGKYTVREPCASSDALWPWKSSAVLIID